MKYIGLAAEYALLIVAFTLALPITVTVFFVRVVWWLLDTITRQDPDRRMRI